MNNVYKELGAQATEYCQARGENTAWLWEEKFAELVILECIKVAEQAESYRYAGIGSRSIKQHFGIE